MYLLLLNVEELYMMNKVLPGKGMCLRFADKCKVWLS